MTNVEVLNNLMARLGGRSSPDLRAKVLFELNEKIRQLENGGLLPWFMEQRVTGSLIANNDELPLPSGFLREVEEGEFKVKNSDGKWNKLFKVSLERLENETENVDPAFPEAYAIFGDKWIFGPAPDSTYDYKIPCFVRTAPVVDNNDAVSNKWLLEFYNLVTLETLFVVANLHVQSAEIAQKVQQQLGQARELYVMAVEGRMHANRDYLLTDEEN